MKKICTEIVNRCRSFSLQPTLTQIDNHAKLSYVGCAPFTDVQVYKTLILEDLCISLILDLT